MNPAVDNSLANDVVQHFWLFEYLLGHEMREVTLVDIPHLYRYFLSRYFYFLSLKIGNGTLTSPQHDYAVVRNVYHLIEDAHHS